MKDSLYLAWRYLSHHRVKTAFLVFALSIFIGLPLLMRSMSQLIQESLLARAQSTPLLLGRKGSSLDLVIEALYFQPKDVEPLRAADVEEIDETGLALGIPIRTGLAARDFPLVGTSLEYFSFRGLQLALGRRLASLGECVLGAEVARELGLGPGDTLLTSPQTLFDLAGVYPLELRVVGVLGQADSPDDRGVFVDIRTAWVAEGLGHGHQDMQTAGGDVLLARKGNSVTANAKLVQYNEISADNLDSFHFHGDRGDYPVTAAIALPNDDKAAVLLRGRFIDDDSRQLLRPAQVVQGLNQQIFRFERVLQLIVSTVGLATALMFLLVMGLSWKLRAEELRTMTRLGCSRWKPAQMMGAEVLLMLLASVLIAFALGGLLSRAGQGLLQSWLLRGS